MIKVRRAEDRGHANYGWLDTYHTFSFADYHDPEHTRFRTLRVMNEDFVAPGKGFDTHPHRDMEIVTYVLQGALEHKDSIGNGEVLTPGEFQRMSAGTGILHQEFNPSDDEPVHMYQIWLFPDEKGIEPSYEQKHFPEEGRQNQFQLVASKGGREGSLNIHQDASIYLACLEAGRETEFPIKPGRHLWVQTLRGSATINGIHVQAGDGLGVSDEELLQIKSTEAELMIFDLA